MLEQHLEKLKSFHEAAKQKSLLKAALMLHISQPAVGKNIKALEGILGVSLFVRHRRGVSLTKSGEELYNFCEHLFLRVQDLEIKIHKQENLSGVIRIGTYETLGENFWPRALTAMRKKYPDLSIELTSREEKLWEHLETGGIDMVVDAEPKTSDQFYSQVIYKDYFGLFCAKETRYSSEINSLPFSFVKHAKDQRDESIENHLRRLKIPFHLHYDVGSFMMTRALIKSDLCVGVLPLTLAETPGIRPFLWKEKNIHFGEHRICATVHESMKSEPRLKEVIQILKQLS